MTAPVHGTANPERTARSPVRDGGDEAHARDASLRRLSWLRAMERATVESWFRDPVADSRTAEPRSGAPADAPASRAPSRAKRSAPPAPEPAPVAAGSPLASSFGDPRRAVTLETAAVRARPRPAEAALAREPSREAAVTRRPAAGLALVLHPRRESPCAVLSTEGTEAAPEATAFAGVARPAAGAREREPLRVHAEWTDDGVRVWLGADRDPSAPIDRLAGALVPRLHRWAEARGTSLAALVCNGHTIWERGAPAPPRAARPHPPAASTRAHHRPPGDLAPFPPHLSHEEETP